MDTCPLNKSMELIGGKWKMQILCTLNSSGPVRYNALRRKMDGVSNTVLIRALRELEDSGLIKRTEYSEVPARVEYETTELCDSLIPILDSLSEWWEVHYASSVKTNDEEEKVKQEARR
jgi:DNA-binding HxlR family transcriptional regulator